MNHQVAVGMHGTVPLCREYNQGGTCMFIRAFVERTKERIAILEGKSREMRLCTVEFKIACPEN
jgi:hypothetical protein